MANEQQKSLIRGTTKQAAQLAAAVSALSLSLGMAQAAAADSGPAGAPCAAGQHCGTTDQIKGEAGQDKKNINSWSWGAPQGGGQHTTTIGSATGGAGAGKTHDRKAGGNDSSQIKLDAPAPGDTHGRKAGGEQHSIKLTDWNGSTGDDSHQLKIDAPAGAGDTHDRKAGGQNIGSATTGAGAGKTHSDVSSYQTGGHGH